MNIDGFNNAAEKRLFKAMQECLEGFLRENAPLYYIAQIGVMHNFNTDDIELRIHLSQTGKVSVHEEEPKRRWLPIDQIGMNEG